MLSTLDRLRRRARVYRRVRSELAAYANHDLVDLGAGPIAIHRIAWKKAMASRVR